MKDAVIIISGGMDSTTLLYEYKDEIAGASARFGEVSDLLDEKEMRWLELSELAGQ